MKKGIDSAVGIVQIEVTPEMTAHLEDLVKHDVYATYWLAYHAELAGMRAIQPFFEEGENAVGTAIQLSHRAMAGVGAHVVVRASVASINGDKIRFSITAVATNTKTLLAEGHVDQMVLSTEVLEKKVASATR